MDQLLQWNQEGQETTCTEVTLVGMIQLRGEGRNPDDHMLRRRWEVKSGVKVIDLLSTVLFVAT